MKATADTWASRSGFLLATIGSAVGIGSIWKFPYEVGTNGGGAFVLVYAAGIVLVVVPLMFAEFAIGRRGGADSAGSIENVAIAAHASRHWRIAGLLGMLTCFLILSFYAVIGGWTIAYALTTLTQGLPAPTAPAVRHQFDALMAAPWRMLGFHALFMLATMVVVMRGIQKGIETAAKFLMPVLALLMLCLAAYSLLNGDAARAMHFLFYPDFRQLTARGVLEALGLGFFSIGVGLGLMITYAAYSNATIDLKQVAIWSVVADSIISLLAGLAVFPIVFANGLDPASGPGLVFVSLPLAFAKMPFGTLAALAFYVLLFVAALSSAISMLEGVVSLLMHRRNWSRTRAALVAAVACFAAGIPTVLSFNLGADWHPLSFLKSFANATFYDLVDHLTSNVMLPLCGLAIAIFVAWAIASELLREELHLTTSGTRVLRVLLRYVAPAAIVLATVAPAFL
jgi:NSS family neurotransmitter:Na+ symporter